MEARAESKFVRQSPRKMRLVIDQIRGKSVGSAVNKGEDQGEVVDVDELYVREAFINEGPRLKRWRAAAMGRAAPIHKPMSHVIVVVDTKE